MLRVLGRLDTTLAGRLKEAGNGMTSSSGASTPIVVDANLALTAVLPLTTSSRARHHSDPEYVEEVLPKLA